MFCEQLLTVWPVKGLGALGIFHLTRSAAFRKSARSASLGHWISHTQINNEVTFWTACMLLLNWLLCGLKIKTGHQVTTKGSCYCSVLRQSWEMEPGMEHGWCFLSLCLSSYCPAEDFLSLRVLMCLCDEPADGSCSEDGHCGAWSYKDQRRSLPAASHHPAQQLKRKFEHIHVLIL